MRYLTRNLDVIAVAISIVLLVMVAVYVAISGQHHIYLVATGIGIAGVKFYLLFRDRLQIPDDGKLIKRDYIILCLVCAIGLFHIFATNRAFPGSLIGLDTWTHLRITMQELDIALSKEPNTYGINHLTITTIGGYFSLMHLYLRGIIEATGMSYKWASAIFVGGVQVLSTIILAFLIGKELAGRRVAVIAALMVANAGWVMFFGQWVIPNGMGVVFSLTVAYLFIKAHKADKQWLVWLSVPVLGIALLTNLLSAIWVVGTLGCLTVIAIGFSKGYSRLAIPVTCIMLLAIWYRVSTISEAVSVGAVEMASTQSFGVTLPVKPATESLLPASTFISDFEKAPTYYDTLNNGNLLEMILDSSGFLLYIGVGLIGCFMMLKGSVLHKSWAILCFGVLAIGVLPSLFGVHVLKERWWYLGQGVMAVPLAIVLAGSKRTLTLIIAIVIISLSVIGLPSNIMNRTLSKDLIVRYAFTGEELAIKDKLTIDTVYQHGRVLGADSYYVAYIQSDVDWYWPQRTRVRDIDQYILSGNFKNCPYDIILLRESLYKEPFAFGNGHIYKITYNVIDRAKQHGYRELWNTGTAFCLVRSKT